MKPPVDINLLMEEWAKDNVVDSTEPGKELLRIPVLHGKYLNIMTHHHLLVKKTTHKYNEMKQIKSEYYSGNLNNPEDLAKYNLQPFLLRLTNHQVVKYIEADGELNQMLLRVAVHEEIVEYCRSVLKELGNRTYQIRSYIDYVKFTAGNG